MCIYPTRLGGFYYLSHAITRNQLIPCRNRPILSTYPMTFGRGQVQPNQFQLSHVQFGRCVTAMTSHNQQRAGRMLPLVSATCHLRRCHIDGCFFVWRGTRPTFRSLLLLLLFQELRMVTSCWRLVDVLTVMRTACCSRAQALLLTRQQPISTR